MVVQSPKSAIGTVDSNSSVHILGETNLVPQSQPVRYPFPFDAPDPRSLPFTSVCRTLHRSKFLGLFEPRLVFFQSSEPLLFFYQLSDPVLFLYQLASDGVFRKS